VVLSSLPLHLAFPEPVIPKLVILLQISELDELLKVTETLTTATDFDGSTGHRSRDYSGSTGRQSPDLVRLHERLLDLGDDIWCQFYKKLFSLSLMLWPNKLDDL
jgi:hypothetical protein